MRTHISFENTVTTAKVLIVMALVVTGVWFAIDFYPQAQYAQAQNFSEIVFITVPYAFFWLIATIFTSIAVGTICTIPAIAIGFLIQWGYSRL